MSIIERREARSRSRTPSRPTRGASVDRYALTKSESSEAFGERVRRSFTPLRDQMSHAAAKYLPSYDYSAEWGYSKPVKISKSSGWTANANPFVITTHAIDDQPIGKYDVFIPGGWSYPIYRYMHQSHRPDMSYQVGGRYQPRRDYAINHQYRPSYMAGELSYYYADLNRSLNNYSRWTTPYRSTTYATESPWYRSYSGDVGLRHFGGYRPRRANHFVKALWV